MGQSRIYLACPYSNSSRVYREYRVKTSTEASAKLLKAGYLVFSPLTMTHPICLCGDFEGCYETWRELDESYIQFWATEIWVLGISGWQYSVGCFQECKFGASLGKPIMLLNPLDFSRRNLFLVEFQVEVDK